MSEPEETTKAWQERDTTLRDLALKRITNPRVHENLEEPLVDYLLGNVAMRCADGPFKSKEPKGWKYLCMEHWVLENGYFWRWSPLTKTLREEYDLEMGPIKRCYNNSIDAALNNPEIMVYVQGFATGIITFPHAWNTITTEAPGNMVDLTLRVEERSAEIPEATYFGVPFDYSYVVEAMDNEGSDAIDDWARGHPLLKNDDLLDEAIHEDYRS